MKINNKKVGQDMGNFTSVYYREFWFEFRVWTAPPSGPVFNPSYYRSQ
jgi:hypothetical protein